MQHTLALCKTKKRLTKSDTGRQCRIINMKPSLCLLILFLQAHDHHKTLL